MGFTDKIMSTLQDVTSVGIEKIDETGLNLKISDKKSEIRKVEGDIGNKVYALYKDGKDTFNDDVKKLCEKIDGINEEIEEIEKEKKDRSDKAQAERQNRRENE